MKKLFSLLFVLIFLLFDSTLLVSATDRFTNHSVEIVVEEDGLYTFNHVIDVDFDTPSQGIYVRIPQVYNLSFTMEDGTVVNRVYHFPVSDISRLNQQTLIWSSYEDVRIRIGTEGEYFTGKRRYTYSYTVRTRDLDLDGKQLFYFSIIGDEWELPVDRVEFKILFPKDVSSFTKEFYSGAYGSLVNNNVNYTVEGNVIFGTVETGLREYEALTIWMPVSDDFFSYPKIFDYTTYSTLYAVLFTVIAGLLYIRFGKNGLLVETVEFNPPAGYSSSQVGYIYDGVVDDKDIVSLIIEWASKGYLTIEELDENTIRLNKISEIDPKAIDAEKTLFYDLFHGRDSVTTKELEHSFYTSVNAAKVSITRHFRENRDNRIYRKTEDKLKILLSILVITITVFHSCAIIYNEGFFAHQAFKFSLEYSLIGIVPVGFIIFFIFYSKNRTLHKNDVIALKIIPLMFAIMHTVFQFLIFFTNERVLMNLMVMASYLISLYIISIMRNKLTDKGMELQGKVLGLRTFIQLAEKDKLEMLVHDDPEYFYKILPYAYVLNVTDIWSKKFESITIQPPNWYVGSGHFNNSIFIRSLSSSMYQMISTMSSMPPSKVGRGGGGFGSGSGGFGGGGRW